MRIAKFNVSLVRESYKNYKIENKVLDSSTKARRFLESDLLEVSKWHNEKFGLICLDAQNKVVGLHIISEGTINQAMVSPREVALRVLLNNATSVIFFHNHPGETKKFSSSDIQLTEKLKKGLELLEIKVIDHILLIVDDELKTESMAELGLL